MGFDDYNFAQDQTPDFVADFSNETTRKNFTKKVLALVGLMLTICFGWLLAVGALASNDVGIIRYGEGLYSKPALRFWWYFVHRSFYASALRYQNIRVIFENINSLPTLQHHHVLFNANNSHLLLPGHAKKSPNQFHLPLLLDNFFQSYHFSSRPNVRQ